MKRLRLMSVALSISCSIGVLMAIIVTGNQNSLPRTAVSVPIKNPSATNLRQVAGLPAKFPVQRRALELPPGVDPITTSSVSTATKPLKRLSIDRVISRKKRNENPYPDDAETVTVRAGDTLFGIARRTGVNAHKLAKFNAIEAPYVIRPGQILRLEGNG